MFECSYVDVTMLLERSLIMSAAEGGGAPKI